jgi:transglutaminase-like putative cysteine protease
MRSSVVAVISASLLVMNSPLLASGDPAAPVKDAVVLRARALADEGRFADAERLLAGPREGVDPKVARMRDDEAEILRRIRRDYALDEAGMLAQLREVLPDASLADVRRWRDEDLLQHRMIDGECRYFVREPSNLLRFCEEAKRRCSATARGARTQRTVTPESALSETLAKLVALAAETDATQLDEKRYRITYTLTLKPKPGRLHSGSLVRIWIPYPQVYRQQDDVRLVRAKPDVHTVGPNWDAAPGGQRQRTLYFEQRVAAPDEPIRVEAVYEYRCAAYMPRLDAAAARPYDTNGELYRTYTAERPPHIVFSPAVREIVAKETAGVSNPLAKAQRLFRWVCENIRYNSEVEYSTIRSLTERALRRRKGDCGVQAMTFITLCRAAGVPARWQSGWQTIPGRPGMHDWAEFHVEPWGWLPADPSYGLQESDDPRVREFYFGHLDPYRLIANLDYGCPLVPRKASFRSEPIDFQRGEVEVDGANLYFDEWEYDFHVEYLEG